MAHGGATVSKRPNSKACCNSTLELERLPLRFVNILKTLQYFELHVL